MLSPSLGIYKQPMASVDRLFPPTFFIIFFSFLIPSLLPFFRPFSFLLTLTPVTDIMAPAQPDAQTDVYVGIDFGTT